MKYTCCSKADLCEEQGLTGLYLHGDKLVQSHACAVHAATSLQQPKSPKDVDELETTFARRQRWPSRARDRCLCSEKNINFRFILSLNSLNPKRLAHVQDVTFEKLLPSTKHAWFNNEKDGNGTKN